MNINVEIIWGDQLKNEKITMKVYSVKGDTEEEYIYTLWDWEGVFYR